MFDNYHFRSVDATPEPERGLRLGQLVNHGEHPEKNARIQVIDVLWQPTLCLFAVCDIDPGDEIL